MRCVILFSAFAYTHTIGGHKHPVKDCRNVRLVLSAVELSGYCGAHYYLYVKDVEGKWHHTATFRLRENNVNGQPYLFDLTLDQKETFVAAALWPADKGVDCIGIFDYDLYVDPECVSEYSMSLPKPYYEPADIDFSLIVTHVPTEGYRLPTAPGSSAASVESLQSALDLISSLYSR